MEKYKADEYYPELPLPLKPPGQRKNQMPCWELDDIDLKKLETSVESMKNVFGRGSITTDSEDTAFDMLKHLSSKYGASLNLTVVPAAHNTGFYLVQFRRKEGTTPPQPKKPQ